MIILSLSLFLLGWLVSYPVLWPLGNWVVSGFGPVVGWLLAGVFALVAYSIGLGFSPLILGCCFGGLALILWLAMKPPLPKRIEMGATLSVALLCTFAATAATFFDFHIFVPDAFTFTYVGKFIAGEGRISPAMALAFLDFGSLPILWQSLSSLIRTDFLYGLAPVLGATLLSSFGIIALRLLASASGKWLNRLQAAGLGCLLVITTPLFAMHSQTVHSILPASLFLLWFWGGVLLYFQERHDQWLIISFVSLLGFTLCRVEAPFFAAAFLALIYSDSRMDSRAFIRGFHPYVTIIFVYYGVLVANYAPHFDEILTPFRVGVMMAPLAALFLLTMGVTLERNSAKISFFAKLRSGMGMGTLIASAVAVALYVAVLPNHFMKSVTWMLFNVVQTGGWGFSSLAVILAFVWLRGSRVPSWEPILWKALACFWAIVLLIGAGRAPYRPSPWDTSNRLLFVVMPLILLILMGRWLSLKANAVQRG